MVTALPLPPPPEPDGVPDPPETLTVVVELAVMQETVS
jgi:hypothetical protein